MLKLFQITDIRTQQAVPGEYFNDKMKAKTRRRELNGDLEGQPAPKNLWYVVSPGPDHKDFNGVGKKRK